MSEKWYWTISLYYYYSDLLTVEQRKVKRRRWDCWPSTELISGNATQKEVNVHFFISFTIGKYHQFWCVLRFRCRIRSVMITRVLTDWLNLDVALHEAVASGRQDLVAWLVCQSDEAASITNHEGRSALHIAAINNNIKMCKVPVQYSTVRYLQRCQHNVQPI